MKDLLLIEIATVVAPGHLHIRFSDGDERTVDVRPLMRGSALEQLRDDGLFAKATVDPCCGTVTWPGGLDFAPEALRALKPVSLVVNE